MHLDVMIGPSRWTEAADTARQVEQAGFSGMTFTETGQTPWMSIAAAATAAPTLMFSTGIAVALPVSPMIAASLAWELSGNTGGRFRLGLGSQVRAHVERRYGMPFEPPGPRMKDYLLAVKACLAAFRGDAPLAHDGPYYRLSLLPDQWKPAAHPHGEIKVDVSAVGPWMTAMAGEVADGIHVHPLHSAAVPRAAADPERAIRGRAGGPRPRRHRPADPRHDRGRRLARGTLAASMHRARTQIGFYGSTKNYAFQFDDLGYEGTSARLNERLKAGDLDGVNALVTDEMLDQFVVIGAWDDIADRLLQRYAGRAARLISYFTVEDIARNPDNVGRWSEIARRGRRLSAAGATIRRLSTETRDDLGQRRHDLRDDAEMAELGDDLQLCAGHDGRGVPGVGDWDDRVDGAMQDGDRAAHRAHVERDPAHAVGPTVVDVPLHTGREHLRHRRGHRGQPLFVAEQVEVRLGQFSELRSRREHP